jgi:hypothetical protein
MGSMYSVLCRVLRDLWGICGEEVDEELAGGAQITSIRSDMHCDGVEGEVEIHIIDHKHCMPVVE